MRIHLAQVALGLVCVAPLHAQDSVAFPLANAGRDAERGLQALTPSPTAITSLMNRQSVRLTGATLSTGQTADLLLRRVDLDALNFGFHVNGEPAPGLLDGLDLSVWVGTVDHRPGSDVMLSFSQAGTRGWIHDGILLTHMMPSPDESGDWSRGRTFAVNEFDLDDMGLTPDFACGLNDAVSFGAESMDALRPSTIGGGSPPILAATGQLYECRMAVETDYQLYQVFGNNLAATTAHVTSLLAASSDRYVEQLNTQLTYPYVQFYTNSNDPWSTPETAGQSGVSTSTMLNEFVEAWGEGNLPVEAELGHFLSGSGLGGGIAYLGVLCDTDQNFTFGVSANLDGLINFPVQQGPFTWDFQVFNHEVGHNFSSPHTHDYCPPVDQCAPDDFGGQDLTGACQDDVICTSQGTLMSYCHLCSGGLNNMTLDFHPTVINQIAGHVELCLPLIVGIAAAPPVLVPPDVPTAVSVEVVGTPVGDVDLNYRFDPGSSYQSVALASQGNGIYAGNLPAASCDDQPEFFFSMSEAVSGVVETDVFTAAVGVQSIFFEDSFQNDQSWAVGAPDDDATTGIWTRTDPLGTGAQPFEGVNSSENGTFCFFTGQGSQGGGLGEEDIDDGKTTLTSPVIDLAGIDADVGYWRWFSNNQGGAPDEDIFVVEITNNGSTWVNFETVGPNDGQNEGGWIYHQATVSDFVTPTANVQLRFIASDEGSGSVVEAAIDEFEVFLFDCEVCQPDLGFGGPGTADLSLCGEALTPAGSATLRIDNANDSAVAVLGYSGAFNPTPLFGGSIVPVPLIGSIPLVTDGSGSVSLTVNGGPPASTIYMQAVVVEDNGSFTISNAIGVEFLP